jgi:carboxylesterase
MADLPLVNPHLDGSPFLWQGGPRGVLLTHGFGATTAEIRPLAEALHQAGYTVAGPLLPGHGTSPDDLNRSRWQEWYAAVEDCWRDLRARCRWVAAGGESTGGLLSLLLAARQPELRAVMAYAPALKLANWKSRLLIPLLSPFIPYRAKPAQSSRPSDARWQGYPVYALRGAAQLVRLQGVVRASLPQVTQPCLVMQGRLDQTVHPQAAEFIYRKVRSPSKQLHWLDDSAHCLLLDAQMEQAFELTLAFLEKTA